jgi:hypothetical protein
MEFPSWPLVILVDKKYTCSYKMDNRMDLIYSMLSFLRVRKKQKGRCPVCHGNSIELAFRFVDEDGYLKEEEYSCHDCDSRWSWTYNRPFFPRKAHQQKLNEEYSSNGYGYQRPQGQRIRPPQWVRIDFV